MENNLDIDDKLAQDVTDSPNITRFTSFDDMNIDLQIL